MIGELCDEASEKGWEEEVCSGNCIHAQHEEVEVLSVLAIKNLTVNYTAVNSIG